MIMLVFYYKLLKISVNRGDSYIDSPKWLKNKKAAMNLKNTKDNKCFQQATAAALIYQQTNNHPEEIYNIRPFIDTYNWKDVNFPSHKEHWNTFEKKNNKKTDQLVLIFCMFPTLLNKQNQHIYQNTILIGKTR